MKFDITKIIYGLLIAILVIFFKDIYSLIKSKFVKVENPRVSINYECKWRSTFGTNPRNYKFISHLIVQNINTEPIYDIDIYRKENSEKIKIISQELLDPEKKIEKQYEKIIPYDETGDMVEEAKRHLPETFRNPLIFVEYKNKNGKNFSIKKNFS